MSIWPDLERGFNISLIAVYCAGMAGITEYLFVCLFVLL